MPNHNLFRLRNVCLDGEAADILLKSLEFNNMIESLEYEA